MEVINVKMESYLLDTSSVDVYDDDIDIEYAL